jgi:hypothetical protein
VIIIYIGYLIRYSREAGWFSCCRRNADGRCCVGRAVDGYVGDRGVRIRDAVFGDPPESGRYNAHGDYLTALEPPARPGLWSSSATPNATQQRDCRCTGPRKCSRTPRRVLDDRDVKDAEGRLRRSWRPGPLDPGPFAGQRSSMKRKQTGGRCIRQAPDRSFT